MPRLLNADVVKPYQEIINNSDVAGKGVSCEFYFVGGNVGLKVYRSRKVRDNNFFMQKLLEQYGLAPRAYKRLNIGNGQYGFTTELCEIAKNFQDGRYAAQAFGCYAHFNRFDYCEKFYAVRSKLEQDIGNVIGDSFHIRDLHNENYGINYRTSEINVIDVGHFRVAGVSDRYGSEYRVDQCPTKLLCDVIKHGLGVDVRKL
jgi:hypothetical protein